MKHKRLLVTLSVLFVTVALFSGCSKEEAETPTEEVVEAVEPVEEIEDITVESVPYAEEHGLIFSDLSSLIVPCYTYEVSEDGKTPNEQADATFNTSMKVKVSSISKSSPDDNGNVTLTIICNTDMNYELIGSTDGSVTKSEAINLYDYYTGQKFPRKGLSNSGGSIDTYGSQKDIEWSGKTYSISYEVEQYTVSSKWIEKGENYYVMERPIQYIYTINMPNDYDGLMLVMDKNGVTEYEEYTSNEIDESNTYLLDDYTCDVKDLWCVRVSDYAKNEINDTDNAISDNWMDGEFLLDGIKLTMPCTVNDMAEAGWILDRSNEYEMAFLDENGEIDKEMSRKQDYMLLPGEEYREAILLNEAYPHTHMMVMLINPTDQELDFGDCTIRCIMSFSNQFGGNNVADVCFSKGISYGATEQEIIEAYGNPSDLNHSGSYTYMTYASDNTNVRMSLFLENDALASIDLFWDEYL